MQSLQKLSCWSLQQQYVASRKPFINMLPEEN
ncbi:hypothetical protein LINGRAHAP2_LOCUS30378 [Linum grandiflorum]